MRDQSWWPGEVPKGLQMPRVVAEAVRTGWLRHAGQHLEAVWTSESEYDDSKLQDSSLSRMARDGENYTIYQKLSGNSIQSLNTKYQSNFGEDQSRSYVSNYVPFKRPF